MNPEQQRIKLAEWDGWIPHPHHSRRWKYEEDGKTGWIDEDDLPNYPFDLNAVHELEKKVHDEKWISYVKLLAKACEYQKGFCHATAAQRCEALLKTLGLWEETK